MCMLNLPKGLTLPLQSSLLGLLLASKFFNDPLVSLPCGISTIFMTLVRHANLFNCSAYRFSNLHIFPPISVTLMTNSECMMQSGFGLVVWWKRRRASK